MVCSKIKINDDYVYVIASDQWELGELLDEIVWLILDKGLHSDAVLSIKICESEYFLN